VLPCSGKRIHYGVVINTDACPMGPSQPLCMRDAITPNGIRGLDNMYSILANTLATTITNPQGDIPGREAWIDDWPLDVGQKCFWNFGLTTTLPGGARYNHEFSGRRFLIQRNWDPEAQKCAPLGCDEGC
jgi:hypothetical protein